MELEGMIKEIGLTGHDILARFAMHKCPPLNITKKNRWLTHRFFESILLGDVKKHPLNGT